MTFLTIGLGDYVKRERNTLMWTVIVNFVNKVISSSSLKGKVPLRLQKINKVITNKDRKYCFQMKICLEILQLRLQTVLNMMSSFKYLTYNMASVCVCVCMCRRIQTGNIACCVLDDVRVWTRMRFALQDSKNFHSKKRVILYRLLPIILHYPEQLES